MINPKHTRLVRSAFALSLGVSLLAFVGCTKKSDLDPTNTFYTSSIAKIKGLDPAFADDMYSGYEVTRIYEGLLQYKYLKRPYELEPCLAEAMPTISKDGKTYTFKLKKGVVFQDDKAFKATNGKGREVTAEDFVYSFKRLADPKLNSPMWWLFDGKIEGLNEWHDASAKAGKSDYAANISGLKAVDASTLQIKLKSRSYQFVYALAMPATTVVAKEVVEEYGAEFLNHPVGTGAFKLAEYNPSAKIVYVKSPSFRKEFYPSEGDAEDQAKGLLADAGKQLPLVDKVVMTVHVESQPQWLNFMQGNLDLAPIPKDNFAQAIDPKTKGLTEEMKKKNIQLFIEPSLDITHTSFNMTDPVVGKNKYLRQAISTAINTQEEIDLFYNGRAVSAQGPIPPGLAGYDPATKNPYKEYNLEKAKELLKKAGYPDGKGLAPLEYLSLADTTARQMTEYFQKAMTAIGIQVKVQTFSWPEFQQSLKNKKGQMWSFAWGADYPDAENFLQLFYSKNSSPGPNDANYDNPEFDKLYEKSLTMNDSPARTELYKKMAAIVIEDTPWAFGVHRLTYGLTHPWLKNYKPHEFNHGMAKYYRIDTNLRK
ncbi:MAG: ABC transporter substrate-binding protein [Bdellovibrionales bacterium]|nr:ABC transporter substrate-binding protein [Bdellovibrionales bacterium]